LAGNSKKSVANAHASPAVTLRPLLRSIQLVQVGQIAAAPGSSRGKFWSVPQSEQAMVTAPVSRRFASGHGRFGLGAELSDQHDRDHQRVSKYHAQRAHEQTKEHHGNTTSAGGNAAAHF
jgi:hypothetical protein